MLMDVEASGWPEMEKFRNDFQFLILNYFREKA